MHRDDARAGCIGRRRRCSAIGRWTGAMTGANRIANQRRGPTVCERAIGAGHGDGHGEDGHILAISVARVFSPVQPGPLKMLIQNPLHRASYHLCPAIAFAIWRGVAPCVARMRRYLTSAENPSPARRVVRSSISGRDSATNQILNHTHLCHGMSRLGHIPQHASTDPRPSITRPYKAPDSAHAHTDTRHVQKARLARAAHHERGFVQYSAARHASIT